MLGAVVACTALGGGVAACGDDGSTNAGATTATTAQESPSPAAGSARRGKAIKVMNSRYGRMLFDGRGRAIYLFTRERGSKSRCYGACAVAWPPVYTRGRPRARDAVDAKLLDTITRRGGRRQVTYNGHPLYYYVTDRRAGQITCQDVTEFGGTWLVVDPDGNAIR
jgi:predicted lipoprotein with Yx(FWY)xxD motif